VVHVKSRDHASESSSVRRATEKSLEVSYGQKVEEGKRVSSDPSSLDGPQMVVDNARWLGENPSGRGKVETTDNSCSRVLFNFLTILILNYTAFLF
jgi:hypothetical protein